jgi:two-component system sensor histidine kinase HydH
MWIPPIPRLKLRTKLMLLTGLLVGLIILLVMVLVSRDTRGLILEETQARGIAIAQLFGATNLNHLKLYDFSGVQQNAAVAKRDNDLLYIIVYSKEGLTVVHTDDPSLVMSSDPSSEAADSMKRKSAFVREIEVESHFSGKRQRVFDVSVPVKTPESARRWATIRIGISPDRLYQSLAQIRAQILQIGLIGLFFGLLGALVVAERIGAPISKLMMGSLRAAEGDLSQRIEVHSGDELESLAANFNYMMDQIKSNQEERIKSERLAAVGHMVNSIVHDCRTPITVIKGFASVLEDFDLSREKSQECLRFIDFEVERMERMLEEILQFARDQKTRMVLVDYHCDQFVRECVVEISALLKSTQIALSPEFGCDSSIRMDPDKLRRAILNIAANAKEALRGRGELKITTRSSQSYALIAISDNGAGMTEQVKKKVFDPFFTHGKSGGFGLGMSITKSIIDGHSGTISVESQPGLGTTFSIQIPLSVSQEKPRSMVHSA